MLQSTSRLRTDSPRGGSDTPLINIAQPVFEILKQKFFLRRYEVLPALRVEGIRVYDYLRYYSSLVLMMEDLSLFSGCHAESLALRYILQRKHGGVYPVLRDHFDHFSSREAKASSDPQASPRSLKAHTASPYAYEGVPEEK